MRSQSSRSDGVSAGNATSRRAAVCMAARIARGSPCQRAGSPDRLRGRQTGGGRQSRTRGASAPASGRNSRWLATERQAISAANRPSAAAWSARGRNGKVRDFAGRLVDHSVEAGDAHDQSPALPVSRLCLQPGRSPAVHA